MALKEAMSMCKMYNGRNPKKREQKPFKNATDELGKFSPTFQSNSIQIKQTIATAVR